MINEYYILKQGNQEGPYTHTQLMDMGINATDFLISPLADGMHQAADLPEFQEYFISMGIYMPTPQNVATFWWRLLAFIIDYVIILVGLVVGVSVFAVFIGLTHRYVDFESQDMNLLYRLLFSLTLVAYHSTFEATTMQGSIGKLICKLIVVDPEGCRLTFGKALARNFSKLLSSLLCGLGFLTILWNPMKQGWHDQVAKTYVIRKGQ